MMREPPARFFGWGDWRNPPGIEPGIRDICAAVNRSGWAWTAESCEGHDARNPSSGWGGEKPMLRFVCRTARVGGLLLVLRDACLATRCCIEVYPGTVNSDAEWSDVLTYVSGDPRCTVEERRAVYADVAVRLARAPVCRVLPHSAPGEPICAVHDADDPPPGLCRYQPKEGT